MSATASSQQRSGPRPLSGSERRRVAVLGMPTLALSFAMTSVSTYLPVLLHAHEGSPTVIGIIVGAEGVMALWVPLLVGGWSDRLRRRGVSRLRFVVVAAPVAMGCLMLVAFVRSIGALGGIVALYFAAYFFAYEPYRALYPDLLDDEVEGRAQSNQALWRGAGTILALGGGGALIAIWSGLPFVLAAGLLGAGTAALALLLPRVDSRVASELGRARGQRGHLRDTLGEALRAVADTALHVRRLIACNRSLRLFAIANCLWEMALGVLKTFVVLYVTIGLGYSLNSASLVIGAVAVIILLGVVLSGRAADRFGALPVMCAGLGVYGLAMVVLVFTRARPALLATVPLVALGGGLVMSLPYAVLTPLMPDEAHGLLTGYYSFSRGVGVMLGPLLGGVAIQLLGGDFHSTHGYAAAWIVMSGAILVSLPVTLRLWAARRDAKLPLCASRHAPLRLLGRAVWGRR